MPEERRVKNEYIMNSGGIYTYTWLQSDFKDFCNMDNSLAYFNEF
jgi:hypothetical protein